MIAMNGLEIEVKFLYVDAENLRKKLKSVGATRNYPMRDFRRVLFDYPDKRFQKNNHSKRLRVRDEGDKVAMNFKSENDTNYVDEIEVEVSSFEDTVNLLEAIGFESCSYQESRRESWQLEDVEVVIDEWPWIDTYIEIEGPSEEKIKQVTNELGFNWNDAKFGSVDTVYGDKYKKMKREDSVSDLPEVKFSMPVPEYFLSRK